MQGWINKQRKFSVKVISGIRSVSIKVSLYVCCSDFASVLFSAWITHCDHSIAMKSQVLI